MILRYRWGCVNLVVRGKWIAGGIRELIIKREVGG